MPTLNPIQWIDTLITYISTLMKAALFNLYNISFFILIVLCMYYIIQAICGSNKGKIGAISTCLIYAIIEMVKTLIIGV